MSFWSRLLTFSSFTAGLPTYNKIDPFDHSWVKKWAAIGDSYGAGLGAGLRLDYSCSRYEGGYSNLMNQHESFGNNPNRTFQYLACSGLKSSEILVKQVPSLKDGLDLITISAGGNDVALGDVLDSCIFQWRHGDSIKCEKALNRSQELIDTVLSTNVELLINATLPQLNKSGRIYYPGYAQFFGESESCNNLSWSVWPRMPTSDRQNLTLDRRVRMNYMVHQVNEKIRDVVEKAGPRVIYIDWDWTFTEASGRFCENPFVEPSPDRKDLLFFEWNTLDDGEDSNLLIRPGDPVPGDTFEGSIGKWVIETMQAHPDWEFGLEGSNPIDLREVRASSIEAQRKYKAQLGFDDLVFWFLPDSWKRVFHPRAMGQHLIANMILHEMAIEKGKELGIDIPKYSPPNLETQTKMEL
jgi:lysophospholipase L1-like esterase